MYRVLQSMNTVCISIYLGFLWAVSPAFCRFAVHVLDMFVRYTPRCFIFLGCCSCILIMVSMCWVDLCHDSWVRHSCGEEELWGGHEEEDVLSGSAFISSSLWSWVRHWHLWWMIPTSQRSGQPKFYLKCNHLLTTAYVKIRFKSQGIDYWASYSFWRNAWHTASSKNVCGEWTEWINHMVISTIPGLIGLV